MANKLDPMDIKRIISLHQDGMSNRRIASVLGISCNTTRLRGFEIRAYNKFFFRLVGRKEYQTLKVNV